VNPTADSIPKDVPTEWSVFEIANGGEIKVKDGSNVPSRNFAVYLETDGNFYVGLWDGMFSSPLSVRRLTLLGVTKQPRTVEPVSLIAEKAQGP
jgi:hypothetical protein